MGKINKLFIVVLLMGLLIPTGLLAQGGDSGSLRSATVDGYVYLQDQSDHSGIAVVFTAASASAVTDTFYTTSAGSFTAGINEGIYSIKYEKEHYISYLMDSNIFDQDITLPSITLEGPFIEISDSLSGTLTNGFKYLVIDDIFVNYYDTLVIEPGCRILFEQDTKFSIRGTVIANGTEQDSILFTSASNSPASGDWQYISFQYGDSRGILNYCIIEYAVHGVKFESTTSVGCNPSIMNSLIWKNSWSGISHSSSDEVVSECKIMYNGNGILGDSNSDMQILNNEILHNRGYGISGSRGYIDGNIISFHNV